MTKVSVIIITQNNEKTILPLLHSMSMQNYKDFNVTIIDRCSIDQTISVAKSFPVKVFRFSSANKTIEEVINLATKVCEGEILFFVKGNCIPRDSDFISSGLKIISKPKAALVFGLKNKENEAPIVRLVTLEFMRNSDKVKKIGIDEIYKINMDVSVFKKQLLKQITLINHPFGIWQWAEKILKSALEIYYQPKMIVYSQENIGFLSYIKERRTLEKEFKKYKKQENEICH